MSPKAGDYAIIIIPYFNNPMNAIDIVTHVAVSGNVKLEKYGAYSSFRLKFIPKEVYESQLYRALNEV